MARYTDIDNLIKIIQDQIIDTNPNDLGYKVLTQFIAALNHAPIADVAPTENVFEEVDKFRTDLMNKFIDLCRGNDYNKLTLLKIGDVVDEMYDRRIAELKNKYAEGQK